MKKVFIPLFLFCVLAVGFKFTQSTEPHSPRNHFIVGTNAEYPPYAFIANGQIVGFDIDIAKEIGKRLDKPVEIRDFPFDSLIAELMFKRVDFVAAGMTPTEERAKRVLFSSPYFSDDYLVIVSQPDQGIHQIDELKSKRVVVNEGYTADLYASKLKDLDLLRLPAPADAFLALNSKRADAFITAKSTVEDFLKDNRSVPYEITPLADSSEGISVVLPKGNSELLEKIEYTLDEMRSDGTLHHLNKKWGLQ